MIDKQLITQEKCLLLGVQFPQGFRTIQVKSGKAYIRKTTLPEN